MPKITPFLWFDSNAEEAMNFYASIFRNTKILGVSRYGDAGPGPKGSVMTARFQIEGQDFVALNGGPHFRFSEAISFYVECEDQKEVDYFWEKLAAGGQPGQCGWLKDKFGLSWQIIPKALPELLSGKDPAKSARAVKAMLGMTRIDIQALKDAAEGTS